MTTPTWLATCRNLVLDTGLDPVCLEVLEAFHSPTMAEPDPKPPSSFEQLELRLDMQLPGLPTRIEDRLEGEVDLDQAEMFARRFVALMDLLQKLGKRVDEARVLRVGAAHRLVEILEGPAPRALRVRALVDYYTSHAALLHHASLRGDAPAPTLEECVNTARWDEVAPSLWHARIEGDSELGPLRINVLRAEGPRLQTLDCRRMARGAGRNFVRQVELAGAMAAISGGFFLYSEPDIEPPSGRTDPVGMLLRDGELLSPPVFHRATLAQDDQDNIFVRRMGLEGVMLRWRDGTRSTIAGSNSVERLGTHPVAFNRAWGDESPDHDGTSVAIVGQRVIALDQGPLPIPLAGYVLALPSSEPKRPAHAPGAPLRYVLPYGPAGQPLLNAIAGGPMLVEDGRDAIDMRTEDFSGTAPPATFSQDETFDNNLLPRMAAGLDGDGRLVLAAVDGRNFQRAPGLTLHQTARLMRALGCQQAMNLDGGSSKRMLLQGRVLDLPTTELVAEGDPDDLPVRPVHTAVLLYYRGEDEQEEEQEEKDPEATEAAPSDETAEGEV